MLNDDSLQRDQLEDGSDRLEEFPEVLDFIAERLRTKGAVRLKDIEALKKGRTRKPAKP